MTEPMESQEERDAALDRIENDFVPEDVYVPPEPEEAFTIVTVNDGIESSGYNESEQHDEGDDRAVSHWEIE